MVKKIKSINQFHKDIGVFIEHKFEHKNQLIQFFTTLVILNC